MSFSLIVILLCNVPLLTSNLRLLRSPATLGTGSLKAVKKPNAVLFLSSLFLALFLKHTIHNMSEVSLYHYPDRSKERQRKMEETARWGEMMVSRYNRSRGRTGLIAMG